MASLILPPLRRSVDDAIAFARAVHGGQKDKAGRLYVNHLARVAGRMSLFALGCPFWSAVEVAEAKQIAWLHDAVEDTDCSIERLCNEGFSDRVLSAVAMVTKPDGCRRYHDWIEHIGMVGSLAAILVKLADVEDNSNPERLALLDEATRERLTKKYAGAADLLRQAAREKGWQG